MKQWYKKATILFLIVVFMTTTGLSCSRGGTQEAKQALKPVTLTFWGVHDDSKAFDQIRADYKALHPNVTIEYRKLTFEEYEDELLQGFALDEGPDIFAFHNTWTGKYQKLMEPMPPSVRVAVQHEVGTVKKEVVTELITQKMYTPNDVRRMFGDTVADDAVRETAEGVPAVYGLPLALDTLALFYNKDILNNAGIALPARFWPDLLDQVKSIVQLDVNNNITVAAIPLGTANNVVRSFDILSLLMMQLRAEMVADDGEVVFNKIPAELRNQDGVTQAPGINGLEFYTSFADPFLASYTWNEDLPNSLDMFINGRSAYFLGYSYHRPIIDAQAPRLNYDVAPMLQLDGYDPVNYANYWMYAASAKSKNKDIAWDFIRFMTTPTEAAKYLEVTERPAALRSLFDVQSTDDRISTFVGQTLTAKSWYRGKDSNAAEKIFNDMITSVVNGDTDAAGAADIAVQQIQQTLR